MQVDEHRLQSATPNFEDFNCPQFSSFRYINKYFPNASASIHRAFSLARMRDCHMMGVEVLQIVGILKEENAELSALGAKNVDKIFRLSFWSHEYQKEVGVQDLEDDELIGYVIIKRDEGRAKQNGIEFDVRSWYVFEGVFAALDVQLSYITPATRYAVTIGNKEFHLGGVLYCQQNSLNKCCAQVAIRSILSRVLANNDIGYGTINKIASEKYESGKFCPGSGLSMTAIKHVIESLGVGCDAWTVELGKKGVPYQSALYAGVEAGIGALWVFEATRLHGNHVIPVFGHTFSKNTWVPDAESSYFMLGKGAGYMPSDLWVGDFLAHDDNFGSDLNIPRKHVDPSAVRGVFVIKNSSISLRTLTAQAATLLLLPEFVSRESRDNIWIQELSKELPRIPVVDRFPRVVFRTVMMEGAKYLNYVQSIIDGRGNRAAPNELTWLSARHMPERIMVVEVSLPQLFPANMKKVASFVFDASIDCGFDSGSAVLNNFVLAHLPGAFYGRTATNGLRLACVREKSGLQDHVELIPAILRS